MDIAKHLEKAEEAVRRRNYPFAVRLYQQLLDTYPDSREARSGLRRALARKYEGRKVSPVLGFLSGILPLLAAGIARLTRNHKGVARALERYLAHDPFRRTVNLWLAGALERAGAPASALAVYGFLAERDPSDLVALKRAGALHYRRKEMNEALAMYEQALAVDPRDPEAVRARKNLAAEGALSATGLATARSSRDLVKDPETLRELERDQRLHRTEEEVEEEMAAVERRLAEAAEDPKALARRAELLLARGDREAALSAYEAAVAAQPESFDLTVRLGDLRLSLLRDRVEAASGNAADTAAREAAEKGLLEAEEAEYRRRVEAHPTDPTLRHDLGGVLYRAGKTDEAIAEFQQAVRDPRRKVDAQVMLGQAFFRKGLWDLARAQLEKALEGVGGMNQKAKDILYNLGVIAEKQGNRQDAAAFYSRIYEVDIGFRDVSRKVEQLKG